jgi:hypothetical protein
MTQRTINTKETAKPEDFGRIWRPFARWQSKFNSNNNINSSENFWTRNFGGYKSTGETPKPTTETPKYKPLVENSPMKPQPNGESSNLFNIHRPIKEPKSNPNYGKKDLNEAQRSLENVNKFKEAYGLNNGNRKPMSEGFGGENIKEGSLSFEFGGEKITFKVSKSDLKGVDKKHANFNGHVATIRNKMAK